MNPFALGIIIAFFCAAFAEWGNWPKFWFYLLSAAININVLFLK